MRASDAVYAGLWILAVLIACAGCKRTSHAPTGCPNGADTPLTSKAPAIGLHLGSRLDEQGRMIPGRVARCGDVSGGIHVLAAVSDAVLRMPEAARPDHLLVHLDPIVDTGAPLDRIECHSASRSLLVTGDAAVALPAAVWLHELAHVAMSGARPQGTVAGRLVAAVEEGVADFVAAAQLGDTRLSDGADETIRDLSTAPPVLPGSWAQLAFANRRFDPHPLGHVLAARLWTAPAHQRVDPADLLGCLAGDAAWPAEDTPTAVVTALFARCPPAARAPLRAALQAWLPSDLFPG